MKLRNAFKRPGSFVIEVRAPGFRGIHYPAMAWPLKVGGIAWMEATMAPPGTVDSGKNARAIKGVLTSEDGPPWEIDPDPEFSSAELVLIREPDEDEKAVFEEWFRHPRFDVESTNVVAAIGHIRAWTQYSVGDLEWPTER